MLRIDSLRNDFSFAQPPEPRPFGLSLAALSSEPRVGNLGIGMTETGDPHSNQSVGVYFGAPVRVRLEGGRFCRCLVRPVSRAGVPTPVSGVPRLALEGCP